jgi:hypothetical protein
VLKTDVEHAVRLVARFLERASQIGRA